MSNNLIYIIIGIVIIVLIIIFIASQSSKNQQTFLADLQQPTFNQTGFNPQPGINVNQMGFNPQPGFTFNQTGFNPNQPTSVSSIVQSLIQPTSPVGARTNLGAGTPSSCSPNVSPQTGQQLAQCIIGFAHVDCADPNNLNTCNKAQLCTDIKTRCPGLNQYTTYCPAAAAALLNSFGCS